MLKVAKEVGLGQEMILETKSKDSKRKRKNPKKVAENEQEEEEKGSKSQKQTEILSGGELKEEEKSRKRRKMTSSSPNANTKSIRNSTRQKKMEEMRDEKENSEKVEASRKKKTSKTTLGERLSAMTREANEEGTDDEGEMRMETDNQTDEEEEDSREEENEENAEDQDNEKEEDDDDHDDVEVESESILKGKQSRTKKGSSQGNENSKEDKISDNVIVFKPSPRQVNTSSFRVQDNLSKVLAQSIKATDESMMEQCLLCTDENMISRTIQYLPTDMASLFLHQIIVRVDKKPNRADQLLIWIKYILLYHASALSNNEKWISDLQTLESITSKRGANYQSLLGLSGRLEMLLAQVNRVRTSENFHNREDDSSKQTIIFQDEDSSDDEDNIGSRTLLLRYN